uniref:Uncharacterized protein n=1 Tax=Noctiluca scintillans TaxID=2966 RepID=A0A7S1F936_NOCSC
MDGAPEESAEPAGPIELEGDAPEDKRARLSVPPGMSTSDSTLNAVICGQVPLLTSLSEGGMQYLLAGMRATVGVKSGRYMIEAKIVEKRDPAEVKVGAMRTPAPRNLLRIGLSTLGSSLLLNDPLSACYFDSEGFFTGGKARARVSPAIGRDSVVAFLVNLDPASSNPNTVSLFVDGVRACVPQNIPEALLDKALFPTFVYRNVSVQVNFGPTPLVALPFACRMLQDASEADVELAPPVEVVNGKNQIVLPTGLPDRGVYDWADHFLEKNPEFTELSDRKILEWITQSGFVRPNLWTGASTDKIGMGFGLPMLDDHSVQQVIASIAPVLKRNYVVVEVESNLLPQGRQSMLKRFPSSRFTKSAVVLMGEPSEETKERTHALMLEDKKAKAKAEKKQKAVEAERKKLMEERRKKAEQAKKARLGLPDAAEEESLAEAPEIEESLANTSEIEVELTEEEKGRWHRKCDLPDVSPAAVAKSFNNFKLPEVEEGFDEVSFPWQPVDVCTKELAGYIHSLKLTTRVEHLQPSEWFKQESLKRSKTLTEWRKLESEWKDPKKKEALLQRKRDALRPPAPEADGEDLNMEEEEAPELPVIDPEEVEVFDVEDVCDIGSGEPLFSCFTFEDWALLGIRFELQLLLLAFKKDLDDPERTNFHESHLPFYYGKYFKKQLNMRFFGTDKVTDLIALITDTIELKPDGMAECLLAEDTPHSNILKLAEAHRRERQRRLDAGDETAALNFNRAALAVQQQPLNVVRPVAQQQGQLPRPRFATSPGGIIRPGGQPMPQYGMKRPFLPPTQVFQPGNKRPAYGAGAFGGVRR